MQCEEDTSEMRAHLFVAGKMFINVPVYKIENSLKSLSKKIFPPLHFQFVPVSLFLPFPPTKNLPPPQKNEIFDFLKRLNSLI